ncbi:MAG: BatA domain-containing protein [Taibaiella sp.]|nr:BatA domain-containing protein [Taibaiella sp.]
MSFIYPLFLLAGLALAIPVLIHLFNLRRYKTVYFPHTRFLKNIQLRSQKQSQLRYKLLLALRMLFLLLLVLAFAQPYFAGADKQDTGNRLQAIYIDNSGSMSLKKESQRLVDIAKETARRQVRNAPPGTRFVLLTNERPVSYRPMPAEQAMAELGAIDISSSPKNYQYCRVSSKQKPCRRLICIIILTFSKAQRVPPRRRLITLQYMPYPLQETRLPMCI